MPLIEQLFDKIYALFELWIFFASVASHPYAFGE
jgi:hypothetical protein